MIGFVGGDDVDERKMDRRWKGLKEGGGATAAVGFCVFRRKLFFY
jgi:hypothetical protein